MGITTLTIQDLIPYRSGRKVDTDAILPFLILPGLLLIATLSRTVTIIVMVVIGMGALYVYSRPRQKNRLVHSPHFHSNKILLGCHFTLYTHVWTFIIALQILKAYSLLK